MSPETLQPLAAEETARLIDFARACKAAARAVLLYPEGHPAIAATLGRIAQLTTASAMPEGLRLTVLGTEMDIVVSSRVMTLHRDVRVTLTNTAGGES